MNLFVSTLKKFRIYIVNSAWVLVGYVIRLLITIFIISRIANQIGTEDFGWYNLAISVFTVLFSFSSLGFNPSFIIKHLVGKEQDTAEVLGTSLVSRALFSSFILLCLALWIVFSGAHPNYWVVLIASTSILFQVSEVFISYYQWKLKADIYVGVTITSLVIISILLIVGIYNAYGLTYFISIYALERLLILVGLAAIFNNKDIKLSKLRFNSRLFKKLFKQSWPLLLGAILTALYSRFDQFLIKYFLTIEDIGIYGTGIILSGIWYVVPSLIIPILYPKIAELKKQGDEKEYLKLITLLYAILNYIAIFIVIFMYIFGNYIILNLYGEEYKESVPVLYILIWNLLILFQSHLTSSVMIIEGRERYLFTVKLAGVIANIALNVFFLSKYGIIFAAYSLIISSIVSWIIFALFDRKMLMLLKLYAASFLFPFNFKKLLK